MLLKFRALPFLVLCLLVIAGLLPAPRAGAQTAIMGQITPLEDSTVTGTMSVSSDAQGAAVLSVSLNGLPAGTGAQINLHAGTCSMPSASVLNLLTVTADTTGRASATTPVALSEGVRMSLAQVADGQHIIVVTTGSVAVACGAIPAIGAGSGGALTAALLAEGQQRQVMRFNPGAALQKRIFAEGFVPNSGEFTLTLEATTFVLQRAEHLRTGTVRVYFARSGDWSNVRYVQRGAADAFGRLLLDEAEQRLAIQFNPNAALQRRIFADAFVPNSPEFALTVAGTHYTAQRAEHLQTGRVRVYHAVTGQWNAVRFVERAGQGPSSATATVQQTSELPGSYVRLTGAGFPPNTQVTAWGGPVASEGQPLGTGMTDASGQVTIDVPVAGAAGMRWVFALVAGAVHAQTDEFVITG
jgi:hypothetical protein